MAIRVEEIDKNEQTVFLKDLAQNKTVKAIVYPTNTVGELKRIIEREFNYENNHFKGYKPRLINKGQRTGTTLDDDKKMLAEYDIKNMANITFSKTKNIGGKYKIIQN